MRRAALAALLLLAGCIPQGTTGSGTRTGVGVLVQGTAGRCTTVIVGTTPRRVCAPGGNEADAAAPADTAAPADSVRVTR